MASGFKRLLIGLSAAPFVLGGCSLGPDYIRPELDLPEQFKEPNTSVQEVANLAWWELFKDEALKDLIKVALTENKDLAVAAARIDASRALLGVTRANQFPRLDGSGSGQRSDVGDSVFAFAARPVNNFFLSTDLSYELDIWGRLAKATEAQRAELLRSEYGYQAITVSLVSQVAVTYLNLIGADDRLEISKRTLKNRQEATRIIRARFEKGVVPELDLNQAQIQESEARVSLAASERERGLAENALGILLGRTPFEVSRGVPLNKQELAQELPMGLPAALITRRPDVLAAEQQVVSATAQIGVAKAGQLPTFNLAGFIGLRSRESSDWFKSDSFTWGYGSNFVGPIIDFGQAASRVDLAEANTRAAVETYKDTVNRAVGEVEDSLVGIRTFKEEHQARQLQLKAARNASRLSQARYDEGVTSYLEVLDIERSLFEAELGGSRTRENYLQSIVQLYRALGGGWDEKTPEERAKSSENSSVKVETANVSK